MRARLIELGLVGLNILIVVLAVVIGSTYSVWAGLIFFAVVTIGLIPLVYNYDYWLVRRLTTDAAPLSLDLCKSGFVGRIRTVIGRLPASPRCRFCLVPFGGLGKLLGIKPSSKNPNFCRSCFEGLPAGTHEMEVGVLFADIRGFTPWTESHQASEVAAALSRFYAISNEVLTRDDAFVQFIGDEVMALYVVDMPSLGERTAEVMLAAARRLVAAIEEDDEALPVGVGVNIGVAQVGTLETGETKDFTAVGDVVNTSARLQSKAQEYEIVLSEAVHDAAIDQVPDAKPVTFELKGKEKPQEAYIIPAAA